MVRPFSSQELSDMQDVQESAMQDTCQLLARQAASYDGYGYEEASFSVLTTTACGFNPTTSREVQEGAEVAVTEGSVRLPLSVESQMSNLDRIRLTHRYGVELDAPRTFAVVGPPLRGPSGIVVNLRAVTDGSA